MQNKIMENFEKGLTSNKYNTTNIENGNDEVFRSRNMTITLTSTENQKYQNQGNINNILIILGICEDLLRQAYNITDEQKIYMKIIDIIQEGYKIPYVKYDVYSRINESSNLTKLNLSVCENTKVDIIIPIVISESLDKLNTSSAYFNDICYISSSNSGTDIILKDRKKEFIEGKKTVCQDGCDFSNYDYKYKKAQCSCDVKESSDKYEDMKIIKEKLFRNFKVIKNIANINILKCYKSLFCIKGIENNIGSYTVIFIFLFHISSIIIFYKYQLDKIKDIINVILFGIKNTKIAKKRKKKKARKEKQITSQNIPTINIQNKRNKKINKRKRIKIIPIKIKDQYIEKSNPPNKNKKYRKIVSQNIINMNNIIISNNTNKNLISKNNFEIIQNAKEIMEYNERELNELDYELALKNDRRSYCEYYISLIKTKHDLIFTFCYNNDYNSKIIKIDLFFINFAMNFTINALFFNDDTMHKKYEEKGKFPFLFQLPEIIYSSIISSVIQYLLQLLALSEEAILDFKKNKDVNNINKRKIELITKINTKFILFFTVSTIFLLAFWYYLSMFCAIYVNTQIHLIKDTIISFAMSLLYPFGIYLLPGIFRIPALSNRKQKNKKDDEGKYIYNLSKILQIL